MKKHYRTFVLLSLLLVVGCGTNNIQSQSSEKNATASQMTQEECDIVISDLASGLIDITLIYTGSILASSTELTNESIDSIKGLIDVKTNKAIENYNKLSQIKGSKQDQIDVLKKAFDKLVSMRESLNQFIDNVDSKKKLASDCQIALNYEKTYNEMTKK